MIATNTNHAQDFHILSYVVPKHVMHLPKQNEFLQPPVMSPLPTDGEYNYETLLRNGLRAEVQFEHPMAKGDSVNFAVSTTGAIITAFPHIITDEDINRGTVNFMLHGGEFRATGGLRIHFAFVVMRDHEVIATSRSFDVNVSKPAK